MLDLGILFEGGWFFSYSNEVRILCSHQEGWDFYCISDQIFLTPFLFPVFNECSLINNRIFNCMTKIVCLDSRIAKTMHDDVEITLLAIPRATLVFVNLMCLAMVPNVTQCGFVPEVHTQLDKGHINHTETSFRWDLSRNHTKKY